MSFFVDYKCNSHFYDNQRFASGADVMAAMIQLYTGKDLKDLSVLDAGCGTGNYAKSFLDMGVGQVSLLDSSSGMLEEARDKLIDYIKDGRISDVVQCTMPPILFPNDTFDAVLFNLVLHHLDRASSDYPNCVETLKDSLRILRPNGLIVISAVVRSAGLNVWFAKLDMKLRTRYAESVYPTLGQFEKMFSDSGIQCVQKMNILGSDLFKNYWSSEGAPDDCWLRETEYMSFLTESETNELFTKIKELKENGEFENWIKENDHTQTRGFLTIFICKPLPAI